MSSTEGQRDATCMSLQHEDVTTTLLCSARLAAAAAAVDFLYQALRI